MGTDFPVWNARLASQSARTRSLLWLYVNSLLTSCFSLTIYLVIDYSTSLGVEPVVTLCMSSSWLLIPAYLKYRISRNSSLGYASCACCILCRHLVRGICGWFCTVSSSLVSLLCQVKMFASYAQTVFKAFGGRVKTWYTFNEPHVYCAQIGTYPFSAFI